MSMYVQAMQSGMSMAALAITGESAETKAAYNQAYQVAAQKASIQSAKQTAQLNVAAIAQDKITSNTQIQMAQDQAEALAIVNSSAAGIEGGSVEDVIYETEKNAAFATNSANQKADQATESQLNMIGSQSSALLAIEEPTISYAGELLEAFSSFELKDLKTHKAIAKDGISSLWSG